MMRGVCKIWSSDQIGFNQPEQDLIGLTQLHLIEFYS